MVNGEMFYTATCDCCGVSWENHDGMCAYRERYMVEDSIKDSGWMEIDGKWYCEDCHFVNDKDEDVINESRRTQTK